jgi:hypothetical protein
VAVLAAENAQLRFALESRLVIEQAKRLRAARGRRSMCFGACAFFCVSVGG